MLTSTYSLNMRPGTKPLIIHVSQYDKGESLVFVLTHNATSADISTGVSAEIRGTKPDGNGFSYEATYSYSNSTATVTVTLTEQMTAVGGTVPCEIVLKKGSGSSEKQLGTCNFFLDVERAPLDKDTIPSNSEIRQLVDVIDNSADIIAAANAATAAAAAIQGYAQQAAAAAQSASQSSSSADSASEAAIQFYDASRLGIQEAKEGALADIQLDFEEKVAEIAAAKADAESYATTALQTALNADQTAYEALEKSTLVENESAEIASALDAYDRRISEIEMILPTKFDDAYLIDGYEYFDANGVMVKGPIGPFAGGGGGGGGGGGNNAVFNASNTSGWMSKTITNGSTCVATFTWSSLEEQIATGDGTLSIIIGGNTRSMQNVHQGNVSVDLSPYANIGSNVIRVNIADVYANSKTFNMSVTVVDLHITSSFSPSQPYTGAISFPYTPVGAIQKTVYFILDGTQIGTHVTSVSGRQQSFTIPQQSHGAHTFRVYFEATINGETVRSNELYYEIICVDPLSDVPIITSSFTTTSVPQYTPLHIDYMVYNPESLTAQVGIYVNNSLVSTLTVDRTSHTFDYRPDNTGTVTIDIVSGSVSKHFSITVTQSDIDVSAETEDLVLYLSSAGRSNDEAAADRSVWTSGTIAATFTDFNWVSDGWVRDSNNTPVMRVSGDARITIPYKIFQTDFRSTGKTIELEFSTSVVMNYDTTIISCMSGTRGLSVTPQLVSLASEQSLITTQFKEDEHVRISFVVEKSTENRLIHCYINGIDSGVVQYPVDDDFSQQTPVNITIGSNYAVTDIYCIRIYDNDLTRVQILDNWIADTQTIEDMLYRYNHNHVYDEYGRITIANLPNDLPYIVISADELPQYKGDKKTVSGYFVNPAATSKNFTFTGAQIDVQGTSSQYYARKNYKIKFKNGVTLANGNTASKYEFITGDIPINVFCFKADVASSEGANNVELARLYNSACPYKTPGQVSDSRVKQGIDGFPMVLFWDDGENVTFMGKYNFNADKSAEEFFGFVSGDESWEIRNNTSNRVLWKNADFSTNDWLNDFEARYPDIDPPYQDPSQLRELAEFLVSTDRDAATGDALSESVTYETGEYDIHGDPVTETFTTDTSRYRLMKFRNEIGDYVELQSSMFYYIFTELFLMVDSRAKNAFPSPMGAVIEEEVPY